MRSRSAAVLSEADAEQHVVRGVILVTQEVRVVRRDDGESEIGGEREHLGIEPAWPFAPVRLDLEVVAVLEQLRVP
jgi:hypothetical protein